MSQRITKPNKAEFEAQQDKLKAELEVKKAAFKKAIEAVKKIQPQDDELNKIYQELNDIKAQQAKLRESKRAIFDQITALESRINGKTKDLQSSRFKLAYKTIEEIDYKITSLESSVESGKLRLLEEKKALAEISQLKKAKIQFNNLSKIEASIAEDQNNLSVLRASVEDPETKALSKRVSEIINIIESKKKERKQLQNSRQKYYALRDKAFEEKNTANTALQKLRDDYYTQLKAYQEQYAIELAARREREKEERVAFEKQKRLAYAKAKLETASIPAFGTEIAEIEKLICYFASSFPSSSSLASETDAKNDISAESGLVKRKNKKTSKNKINLNLSIIEALSQLNINIPSSKNEVPSTLDKLHEKLTYFKENQDKATKENIAKAQEEIDKVEAEIDAEAKVSNV